MRCTDVICHMGPTSAERLGRPVRAVSDRLVLHLGIQFGASRRITTDSQIQTMKPMPAPSEP